MSCETACPSSVQRRRASDRQAVAESPSDSTSPPHMTLLQQGLDVLVQIALAHLLCGVVVANDRPAIPLLQGLECLLSAYPLPCQQAYEVSQEELDVLAREASRGLVVPLVFRLI